MNRTSVASYKNHVYSGSRKNRKRIRAGIRRYHGDSSISRSQVWCKKPKKNNETLQTEGPETSSNNLVKTYTRHTHYHVSASANEQKCSPPSVVCSKSEPLDINWPKPDPSTSGHELIIETTTSDNLDGLSGNRIVDLKHVLRWAFSLEKHRANCESSTIEFVRELQTGFNSIFIFKCTMCDKEFRKSNEVDDDGKLNKGFVWGTVTGGGYYTQAAHLTNILDVPTMGANTFRYIESQLGEIWMDQLTEEINKVGREERDIAIEKGQVNSDGVPYIEVYVDGGWAKRSYGHDYNSASGMACIIGKNTKKCLYLGVKNKYCYNCHMCEKESKAVTPHTCFKNYQGPSTGMEAAILVEGFQKSMEMHGVQYLLFVGDGDSSVFAQLKEKVSYGQHIRKIECKNHVIKNYTSALYKILANTKLPIFGRKLLKPRLSKLTVVSRKIIMHNHDSKALMRTDLQNGPLHVFGNHQRCKQYYCKYTASDEEKSDENCVENMKKQAPAVWALICAANEAVMAKTSRLSNDTTNYVENFMSIVSKFNCGKRLHLHKGGSYQRRVQIAGLSQVSGQAWHRPAWRKCTASSPGKTFKKYLFQHEKSKQRRKLYVRRRLFVAKPTAMPDKHYGPEAQKTVDTVSIDDLKKMCSDKIIEYQKTSEEIKSIEEASIGQHDNDFYIMHRSDRLTASQFGLVCKRRKTTPCHNHVKQILYKNNVTTSDMMYGQQNESVARTYFAENFNKEVRQAGLFIDEEYGFLGASPDGVVQKEEAIVEIKCFPSLARNKQDIPTAVKERKNFPIIDNNGVLEMNKKHSYYYQVQGQLRVTKMKKCFFICFVSPSVPITVIEVQRDEPFITEMVAKLVTFFKNAILPEIILRRISQGAKCLDCVIE